MLTTIYENPKKIFYPYSRRMQDELTTPRLVLYGFRYVECITTSSWMLVFNHLVVPYEAASGNKK